jgi:hypothetical protein
MILAVRILSLIVTSLSTRSTPVNNLAYTITLDHSIELHSLLLSIVAFIEQLSDKLKDES